MTQQGLHATMQMLDLFTHIRMHPMPQFKTVKTGGAVFALFFILTAALLAACSGLGGEPAIVRTLDAPDMQPTVILTPLQTLPTTAPDIANGARIFQARCTECHGSSGDGQGPRVLAGEVPAMSSFLEPGTAFAVRPVDWFEIITSGRIESLMPPWRDALSDQERWDVAMYVYTLHYTDELLAAGRELWEAGRTEGPDAPESGPDLSDPLSMSTLSDQNLYDIIAGGGALSMPAFEEDLTEAQRMALVAYVRTLSLADSETVEQPAAEEPSAAISGTVSGQVFNGTAAATLPASMTVELRYGNAEDGIEQRTTTTGPDGRYSFDDVPIRSEYEYATLTFHRSLPYISEVIRGGPGQATYELPITIYELTEDASLVSIRDIAIVVEPFRMEEIGTGLLFSQLVTFENSGDRVYTTSQPAGAGRFATLLLPLPPGALILNDEADPRYLLARREFAIIDTAPVYPQSPHIMQVFYFLPYSEGAIIEQVLNNAADASIEIHITPPRLRILSDALSLSTTSEDAARGMEVYRGQVSIERGGLLRYEITGALFGPTVEDAGTILTSDQIGILIGPLLLVVLAFVFLFWSRRGRSTESETDTLAQQIAELDALHEQGQINHDVYQRQRQELRARLAELMQDRTEP